MFSLLGLFSLLWLRFFCTRSGRYSRSWAPLAEPGTGPGSGVRSLAICNAVSIDLLLIIRGFVKMSVKMLLGSFDNSARVRVFDTFGACLYDSARESSASYCVNIASVVSFSVSDDGLSIVCDM